MSTYRHRESYRDFRNLCSKRNALKNKAIILLLRSHPEGVTLLELREFTSAMKGFDSSERFTDKTDDGSTLRFTLNEDKLKEWLSRL